MKENHVLYPTFPKFNTQNATPQQNVTIRKKQNLNRTQHRVKHISHYFCRIVGVKKTYPKIPRYSIKSTIFLYR